jgi:2-keto-4-pentenoate hydratase/2-oxohepta-3-ene-1,7-dioic acid hydratase in catechol pathway
VRVMNVDGRLTVKLDAGIVDVASASSGRFGPDVQSVYPVWEEFTTWAAGYTAGPTAPPPDPSRVGAPVPRPHQVFAIGANYRDHVAESGLDLPTRPMVFTKFPASVTGPYARIGVPPGQVDWEVELVAVIGRRARNVSAADAWSHVAGLTVGQDLSERELQTALPAPQQFSLAKSYEGFAPIGPELVTPDEFDDPDDIEIACDLGGEQMQKARTSDCVFTVSAIVAFLSRVLPLLPGDLVFTGTPSGVGWARSPQRFIQPGEELVTRAEGIGEMRNTFVSGAGVL